MNAARTFLSAELSLVGGDAETELRVALSPARVVTQSTVVTVRTRPVAQCPEVMLAADAAVRAIGGAGMDALVAKAQRVWQVSRAVEGDARAPLVLAATLATVMLAPVVDPDEAVIYGVRGARVRLERMGWA